MQEKIPGDFKLRFILHTNARPPARTDIQPPEAGRVCLAQTCSLRALPE